MKTIHIPYTTIDVTECAKAHDIELTEQQAYEILVILKTNHDMNEGINVEVIDKTTDKYLNP